MQVTIHPTYFNWPIIIWVINVIGCHGYCMATNTERLSLQTTSREQKCFLLAKNSLQIPGKFVKVCLMKHVLRGRKSLFNYGHSE